MTRSGVHPKTAYRIILALLTLGLCGGGLFWFAHLAGSDRAAFPEGGSFQALLVSEAELAEILQGYSPAEIPGELPEEESPANAEGRGESLLLMDGYPVPYDKNENRYLVSQNMIKVTDVSGKTTTKDPGITASHEGEYGADWKGDLTGAGGRQVYIAEDELSGDLSAAIRENHDFGCYILCPEDHTYRVAKLAVTSLPVLDIHEEYEIQPEYPIEDIDNYVFESDLRRYGNARLFMADGAEGSSRRILESRAVFHERGQTSANFSKKNYALRLLAAGDEKSAEQSLLGMNRSAKWKLNAMYSDKTKLRDKVCLDLWREISEMASDSGTYAEILKTAGIEEIPEMQSISEGGARMEYCELLIDGEYQGLYGLMESVDEHSLHLKNGDVLYKILDWEMPAEEEIQSSIDAGYPVCYPIRIRYPEKEGHSLQTLWQPMRENLSAKYWQPDLTRYLRMSSAENLADYLIYIQAVAGFDNYLKNTYIAARKSKRSPTGYGMTIIPWDMNYTFGDVYVYDGDHNYTVFDENAGASYYDSVIEQLFRENTEGAALVLSARWEAYRNSVLSAGHIKRLMDENMEILRTSGALARDTQRWPGAENDSDLTEIKAYTEQRGEFLEAYFGKFQK